MALNNKNIKLKIDKLDAEIKLLEIKINEMSWQRIKYQQFYEKNIVSKTDRKSV